MSIKTIIENLRWHAYWCDRTVSGCTARQTLRDAADALERLDRHGRWKGAGMGDYRCSLCSEVVSGNNHNYCPNCGARMEGVSDAEE